MDGNAVLKHGPLRKNEMISTADYPAIVQVQGGMISRPYCVLACHCISNLVLSYTGTGPGAFISAAPGHPPCT